MVKKHKRKLSPNKASDSAQTASPIRLMHYLRAVWRWFVQYWRHNWWHKVVVVLLTSITLCISGMYGIAKWYTWDQHDKPLELGASFIPEYAQSLGVDPHQTLQAMLNDLGVKQLRLVGYWNNIETTEGHYDFSELDWEFAQAQASGARVSLAIGLRQPRWPECHMPDWAASGPKDIWSVQLKAFMKAVINHYKDNPVLQSYQLENEFFLKVFGNCPDFSRDRLIDEYDFVKSLDSNHPVIISRSNNALGLPIGQPQPDMFGVSVYKRVWDITITKRYVEYPFPAWFYGFLGGAGKILTGKDLIIHELQAEPWPPNGMEIKNTPLAEQSKSLDAQRLAQRFQYGEATGLRTIDLWGAEYWYYRKEILRDPSLWNVARTYYQEATAQNMAQEQARKTTSN